MVNEGVELSWQTASEYNNDYFIIQHSVDGERLTELTKISGAIESNIRQDYKYLDSSSINGKSYYRLVQVDLDGSKTNYKSILVEHFNREMVFYPNPASEKIMFTHSVDENIDVIIYNVNGAKFHPQV